MIRSLFRKKPSPEPDRLLVGTAISGVPAVGYTLQSSFVVTLTGNLAFRADTSAKVSTITASASYSAKQQFTMPIESSIWSPGGRFNLVGDYRFFKYPQSTFGLGSASLAVNEDPMDYSYVRFYESLRRELVSNLTLGLGYAFDYHWNISHQGPSDPTLSDYVAYGASPKSVSSGLTATLTYDSRDNPIRPTGGRYASVQYRDNLQALGSDGNWQSLLIDLRTYFRLTGSDRHILAFWSYDWLTLNGKPPYLDLPSTSWDTYSNTGRGYIQGRFRGPRMVYVEGEYRAGLTANGLLGGVAFVNGQSFSAALGGPLQAVQIGYGFGLRLKLNKRSGTNVSIDYGFGSQGSNGLFINLGEMF